VSPRTGQKVPTHVSAGIILVDGQGRILLEHRSDDPSIMFPGFWGITGGAAQAGESPEEAARREVAEETGLQVREAAPFRRYPEEDAAGLRYELYIFHAPLPAGEARPGEGQALRLFSPGELWGLPLAYNHAQVLADFLASDAYRGYRPRDAELPPPVGETAGPDSEALDRLDEVVAEGKHWFLALLAAIAAWRSPSETVDGRRYEYLIDGEAFDWLLLAERLSDELEGLIPEAEREDLLFHGRLPVELDEEDFRRHLGVAKFRAHLNFLYGVRVEEALQLAVQEEVHKERLSRIWENGLVDDEVSRRLYGATWGELLQAFRRRHAPSTGSGQALSAGDHLSLAELAEFTYWLFRYRLRYADPARVASDTRKGLAVLSRLQARRVWPHGRLDSTPPLRLG